jgi:hypothetical protein
MRTLKKRYLLLAFVIFCILSIGYYRTPSVIKMGDAKLIDSVVNGKLVKIIRVYVNKRNVSDFSQRELRLLNKKCNSNDRKISIYASSMLDEQKALMNFELPKDFDYKILDNCLYIETTQTMFGNYVMSEPIKIRR